MAATRSTQARPLRSRFAIPPHLAEPLERSEERWMSEDEARRIEASLFSDSAIDTPVKAPQGSKPIGSPFEIPPSLHIGEHIRSPKEVESP